VALLWGAAQATGQSTRDGFAEMLPVFTSGMHTGKHLLYQHEKFVAWIDAKGWLRVQPLDGGKPAGRAFSCLTVEPYYNDKGTTVARPMQRFQDVSAPAVLPASGGKFRLKGRLEENIPFVAEYTFSGNIIKATGGCQDHPSTKPPTNFRLLTRFAPTHSFPQGTPLEKIEAATRGLFVEVIPVGAGGQKIVYPYSVALPSLYGPYTLMTARGAFGPRVITFKPTGKEGRLHGYIYAGFCPYQGWCVQYITQGKRINLSQNEATMIIE